MHSVGVGLPCEQRPFDLGRSKGLCSQGRVGYEPRVQEDWDVASSSIRERREATS